MILRQYLDTDPVVAASYLVGCGGRATAAVIDPVGDPDRYLRASEKTGMAIAYVIDTHVHADHLSSGLELARAAGAEYALHESAGAMYDFRALRDGERLELGNVLLEVLHVPGHTPEHLALLVTDRVRSAEPWLVLSGHTLMVGDMGRTELATTAVEGASALFESAEHLRALPDYVALLPGAFSGSVCGRGLSGNPTSTIGFERRFNRAFSLTNRDDFLAYMMRDTPPRPPDAERTREENLGLGAGHPV
jgi:glyoxylase-like metal-dependent hydrolase (beta-lactamase superfamily II)